MDVLNVRLWDPANDDFEPDAMRWLRNAWNSLDCQCKINASVGCLLTHKVTGAYRYFHSSPNEGALLRRPTVVASEADLEKFVDDICDRDIQRFALRRRPNTEWRLYAMTNVTFYIYKLLGINRVGNDDDATRFPSHLKRNKYILCCLKDPKTGRRYDDKMCFFRCLAVHKGCECGGSCGCRRPSERLTKELFRQYAENVGISAASFQGICESDLYGLEKLFAVAITVFDLHADKTCDVVWNSKKQGVPKLYLNLHDQHFSYVRDVEAFCKSFRCHSCQAFFTRASSARRHTCDVSKVSGFVYETGVFAPPRNVFDDALRDTGIRAPDDVRFGKYFLTFDIEAMLPAKNLPANTDTTTFHSEHQLLSVSVCSNVPGFREPKCFVRTDTEEECVRRFVDYANDVAIEAEKLNLVAAKRYLRTVRDFVKRREDYESEFADERFSNKRVYDKRAHLGDLEDRVRRHLRCVPIISFNGARYDINVIKAPLMKCLAQTDVDDSSSSSSSASEDEDEDRSPIEYVVKKQDSMTCVQTERLRFLDITNFISPGFTYDSYLKAYGARQQKGFFPYEWVDCLEKLDVTTVPPVDAFYSRLRKQSLSPEDYETVVKTWNDRGMKSVRDLLVWYNNLDVAPFVEAVEKQILVYREKNIDMLKEAVSVPGVAVLWLFSQLGRVGNLRQAYGLTPSHQPFYSRILASTVQTLQVHRLDNEFGAELYALFRSNLVGGPSVVFHRYHEKGATRIRPVDYGDAAKPCEVVLGVDANALYLYCLMQEMPVGRPRVRREADGFSIANSHKGKTAQGWLAWMEFSSNCAIETELNGGERRLGRHNLPVDGFCEQTNTVYQFHGCFWHGHSCSPESSGDLRGRTADQRLRETVAKQEYLESLGYALVVVWECDWRRCVTASPELRAFLAAFFKATYGCKREANWTTESIVNRVLADQLFGFVECDIHVPSEKWEYFKEMSPIFKNTEVSRDDLDGHMKTFAQEEGFLKRPQRYLVGSMKGEKILLLTELLKWYLNKGLVVTRVYRVVEYERNALFRQFGLSITESRRQGDADSSQKLKADTSKLIGNSAYGKLCQDKTKYRNVTYCTDERKVSEAVRSSLFQSVNALDDDVFEVTRYKRKVGVVVRERARADTSFFFFLFFGGVKKRVRSLFQVRMDVCIHIGFSILQYAKLRMLSFHFDFLDR